MKNSILYDTFTKYFYQKWKCDEEHSRRSFDDREDEMRKALINILGEDNEEMLIEYALRIEDDNDQLNSQINLKTFYLGIKIGLELGQSFEELEL